jgi:hypothetical protein
MKTHILKTTAVLLILTGCFSCGKEKGQEEEFLDLGMYVETYPIQGRTRINFIDREKLAIIRSEDKFIDEFYYSVNNARDSIYLTLVADPSSGGGMVTGFYFKIITASNFEIGYLYSHTMEGLPPSPITFEKENSKN